MLHKSINIIGAGASGLFCAAMASKMGLEVNLFEKNTRPGRKLLITGKGRCNVTNNSEINNLIASVPKNSLFLYSAFSHYAPSDVINFFEQNGVPLKTERGNRVFPVSDKSVDIVDCLVKICTKNNVKIINTKITKLLTNNNKITAVSDDTQSYIADCTVIATGGCTYPQTGSTGDGYEFAKSVGHTVTDICPSLVPLEIHEGYCTDLQGLSLKNVSLKLVYNNKIVFKEQGELLFTHFGITGPLVLSASAHVVNNDFSNHTIVIDLKPALDETTLENRLIRDFTEAINKNFINALADLLPKKMVPVFVKLTKIPASKKVHDITKTERSTIVSLLKNLQLHVTGPRSFEEAVITRGGIDVKEINPKTLESKIVSNLYFIGEVVDVDAYTGGYNLQIAFSTAALAAHSIANNKGSVK